MADDLATSAASQAQPGTTAGVSPAGPPGYELLDEVGRGGMGVVYRARDLALGRDVAVKLLADRYPLDSPAAQRFLGEARITGQLQHPGIPAVHQVGRLPDGRPFLAMKLIKGCTLEAVLKDRPDPSAERGRLLAVFEVVCQAVGYAHAHRVIHRDLKPANVMVGAFGEVQVMDWGLAKVLGEEGTAATADSPAPEATRAWTEVNPTPEAGSHTQAGSLVGTPAFIPPEQAAGELAKVDERADVFGLGALLAVILTGKPPYVGEGFESVRVLALRGKLDDCLARLEACGAEPELVSLCRQCLAFEPADRPRDAGEVAQAVARLRSAAEERARTAEREKAAADARSAEQRRKRQWQLAAAGVVAVALVGGLVGLGAYLRNLAAANQREKQAKAELETALYFHRIALAHRELTANIAIPEKAEALLDACPVELRDWEWHYLKRLWRAEPVVLRDPGNKEVNGVAFSPDGAQVAAACGDGTVKVWDLKTGQVVLLRGHGQSVFSVAFSPTDGRRLASASRDKTVKVWDLLTQTAVLTLPGHEGFEYGSAYDVAFSPDGRWLAAGSADGDVRVWDARTGQTAHSLPGHTPRATSVSFGRDGRLLATGDFLGTVRVWDAQTGRLVHTLCQNDKPVGALAFSPDGGRLAAGYFGRYVTIWDPTTGKLLQTLPELTGLVLGLAFSPDGRRLACGGEDKLVRIWELSDCRPVLDLRGHGDFCQCLAFSPDGRRLASASLDKTLRLWDATPLQGDEGEEAVTFRGHTDWAQAAAVSPDGRLIASGSPDGTARVWDRRTGESRRLGTDSLVVFSVAFSPDGRRLAAASNERDGAFVVKVWDVATGQEAFRVHDTALIFGVAFSPDGRWLVTAGARGTIKAHDATTGQEVRTLGRHDREIFWGLPFSADGRRLAAASNDGTVKVWDTTPGQGVGTAWAQWLLLLGLGPQAGLSAHVPWATGGQVYVASWCDRNWPQPLLTLRGSGAGILTVALSPDGRRLVTGTRDGQLGLWDAVTGQEVRNRQVYASEETVLVAFSPDGRLVATAGEGGGLVKVWDATTLAPVHTFRGHRNGVRRLVFSPDGNFLVSASKDRTVKVWDLTRLDKGAP
jgi:WD40 repeat protein